ncbi:alpha/beta hydrolase [Ramlibacter sp. MMS24-I3-19]|uniref:alpha/beta hydrolase n=1 Tax=Ramlibacter sp. MMS24-I3-19 TaxID=3416606 RepID=UPI003D019978
MRRLLPALLAVLALLLTWGCSTLDEHERAWIFQPSDRAWGNSADAAEGMDDVWISFASKSTSQPAKLHGLWLEAQHPRADTPVLLYLHGARWNVEGSAGRMRRMRDMGFSVLAIDYRGFGKSSPGLPSEDTAYEDARAAWDWLAAHYPQRPRYIFGHSLGGAVAIDLAARVADEKGTIVEGTFTSIPELASTFRWGWLPFGPLVTQRFDSLGKVARIGSPLLVVHGSDDTLVPGDLARRLYDAAGGKKRFLLVEGGSHHSTMSVGRAQYREAVQQLFSLR